MQQEDSRPVVIYALMDPLTGEARYIGQTMRSLAWRLSLHLSNQGGKARVAWINGLRAQGLRPTIVALETTDRAHAAEREDWQIAEHRARGCALTNARRASRTRKARPDNIRPRRQRDVIEKRKVGRPPAKVKLEWDTVVRLPHELGAQVDELAARERRPRAVMARFLLEEALAARAAAKERAE